LGDKNKGATHTIEDVITLARNENAVEGSGNIKNPTDTAGKYIQTYLVLGTMPEKYLDDSDSEKYIYQMQVVCFYQSKDLDGKPKKQGCTLLALKCKNPLKLIKRDEVFGRALGFGGVEELVEPQAWTNYNELQKKKLLMLLLK